MAVECLRFLNEVKGGEEPRWLTLCGDSGTGKTHVATRMWRWFDEVGRFYPCLVSGATLTRRGGFYRWNRLLSEMRQGNWAVRDAVMEQWFVVLDDIGTENDRTGLAKEQLCQVIDGRIGKWTVITSNVPVDQIAEQLDVRIASRLIRGRNRVVAVKTTDYALRGQGVGN